MDHSPPPSPSCGRERPSSAMMRPQRSLSRMSANSHHGARSRTSDDDGAKTAVKVAVRVRPPLQPTDPGYDLIPPRFRGSVCEVTSPTSLALTSAQGKKLFVFDRVFGEDVGQEGIWEYLSDSVNSFVQGYNVSILAYGQSGAGKSYTMGTSGPREQSDPTLMGVVPRAAAALLDKLAGSGGSKSGIRTPQRYSTQAVPTLGSLARTSAEKNWTLKATYVEIYNDQLRDLLVPENVREQDRGQVSIREDTKGKILVTGLTQVNINSVEDLLSALNFGSSIRQTDSTAINAKSSRSHAVFSLRLEQKKSQGAPTAPTTPRNEKRFSMPVEAMSLSDNSVTIDSKLHFVDLAGSERLKNTKSQGDRAREGISINAGLASLGKVITELSTGSAHVSYRDSRLTRLLQDSLGGSAITYMVACVTPAEFHSSETVNTVQYAQRARAIQSQPEIQHVDDDNNKQAAIERLRAEVKMLRDQLRRDRSSEGVDRRSLLQPHKAERWSGREAALQEQLLTTEEQYNALSQRHQMLIKEISKAQQSDNAETPLLRDALGDTAVERLKRSNSFAEAVEQVVFEYEKTIQTLEASLSNTRSSLSNTESDLLEKESRLAYLESMQQQLQTRMQKVLDRDQSNEAYVKELEAQIDGANSGEERNTTTIQDLRKELSRVRETESNCEDYISTLEERLAEAEQDQEIMQREIDRLEHVVERQRSIGRMDHLLTELDKVRQTEASQRADPEVDAQSAGSSDPFHKPTISVMSTTSPNHPNHSNGESDLGKHTSMVDSENEYEGRHLERGVASQYGKSRTSQYNQGSSKTVDTAETDRSFAQSTFMADKLETVTQELFDLRLEHESTVTEHDELQRKYQVALTTLARLQDEADATRTPTLGQPQTPTAAQAGSFLAGAGMSGEKENGQPSFSRTLLSEVFLPGQLPTTSERATDHEKPMPAMSAKRMTVDVASQVPLPLDDAESMPNLAAKRATFYEAADTPLPTDDAESVPTIAAQHTTLPAGQQPSTEEMEALRRLHAEKEISVKQLMENYTRLQQRHQSTLAHVEELRGEVQRAQSFKPSSPGFSPVVRRKPSQDLMSFDGNARANRSFASLRNIAVENFDEQPSVRQNFEANLDIVMSELHTRSERVQTLESELATIRKEMEAKMQIISGLTRERSSLKANASAVDFSVVGQMRDQLNESEHQIRSLHESHAAREEELQEQIDSLRKSLGQHAATATSVLATGRLPTPIEDRFMPGDYPETPAIDVGGSRELGSEQAVAGATSTDADQSEHITRLQRELSEWETKHHAAMESMKASEQQLLATITSLEASMRRPEMFHDERSADSTVREGDSAAVMTANEQDRATQQSLVKSLEKELDEYKTSSKEHVEKLSKLEQSHASILSQVEEDKKSRDLTHKELQTHRELVANLENQLEAHKSAHEIHQQSLKSLHVTHAKELDDLRTSTSATETQSTAKNAELEESHQLAITDMESKLTNAQNELLEILRKASSALGHDTDANNLQIHIQALADERRDLHQTHSKALEEHQATQQELQEVLDRTVTLEYKISELKMINEEALLNLQKVTEKERKSSRLVEELEEQLSSNFDRHQAANNRLSAWHGERQQQLEAALQHKAELERELEDSKSKIATLESQLDVKRQSLTSNRESTGGFDIRQSLSPEAAAIVLGRTPSQASNVRKSGSPGVLPSPPPAIPLPPLPGTPNSISALPAIPNGRAVSPAHGHSVSPPTSRHASKDLASHQLLEEQEGRIRTIEKHLFAEKQLTATLEEALVDLESSSNRTKAELDAWKKRSQALEDELVGLRKERTSSRASLQAVEEEREMRIRAERARMALEERMRVLSNQKRKKRVNLNCF
ncbi:hypothetical protein LTR66_006341 [Elasticomyces elasticus]|nr:hypothetical protein LTR66_006341 [Elasticomyces elasticus]